MKAAVGVSLHTMGLENSQLIQPRAGGGGGGGDGGRVKTTSRMVEFSPKQQSFSTVTSTFYLFLWPQEHSKLKLLFVKILLN